MIDIVEVVETFVSLQGESSFAGRPCFFVRMAGCNLRCRYCDTPNAYFGGREMTVGAIVHEFRASRVQLAEITGGEPLLQAGFPVLAREFASVADSTLLVETNGSQNISRIPKAAVAIMDVKCPGSGEVKSFDLANLKRLRPHDEVKFVIWDRRDYDWARRMVVRHRLDHHCHAVHFSPVAGTLAPAELGAWILNDRLPVRLQIQLHKMIGMR